MAIVMTSNPLLPCRTTNLQPKSSFSHTITSSHLHLKGDPKKSSNPNSLRRDAGTTRIEAKRSKSSANISESEKSSGSGNIGEDVGAAGVSAIVSGLVANPVIVWSLFTLKTTGCGLPPGPGGALGALEGISYLAIVAIIGWSIYTKSKTGSGLPPGPFGLLGAVEGLSYLSILAIAIVFGLQYLDYGYIPSATPDERCFG